MPEAKGFFTSINCRHLSDTRVEIKKHTQLGPFEHFWEKRSKWFLFFFSSYINDVRDRFCPLFMLRYATVSAWQGVTGQSLSVAAVPIWRIQVTMKKVKLLLSLTKPYLAFLFNRY